MSIKYKKEVREVVWAVGCRENISKGKGDVPIGQKPKENDEWVEHCCTIQTKKIDHLGAMNG
jgi:hypothetical protein